MQTIKPLHLHRPLLVWGGAAILASGIAIGSLAISAQGSNGDPARAETPEAAAAPAAPGGRAYYKCAECGVIESTRVIEASNDKTAGYAPGRTAGEIGAKPVGNYEITIRLRDGSMRVITDANPARWRAGERVKLIGGADWPGG
jgi:hypothetical protein